MYLFRTRLGRWLHCVFRQHEPVTYYDSEMTLRGCKNCLRAHNRSINQMSRMSGALGIGNNQEK